MKRILITMLLCVGVAGAQQVGSLVWNPNGSSITVTGPSQATTLSLTLPAKNGTFALLSDIPTTPPSIVSGSITLNNGAGARVTITTTPIAGGTANNFAAVSAFEFDFSLNSGPVCGFRRERQFREVCEERHDTDGPRRRPHCRFCVLLKYLVSPDRIQSPD